MEEVNTSQHRVDNSFLPNHAIDDQSQRIILSGQRDKEEALFISTQQHLQNQEPKAQGTERLPYQQSTIIERDRNGTQHDIDRKNNDPNNSGYNKRKTGNIGKGVDVKFISNVRKQAVYFFQSSTLLGKMHMFTKNEIRRAIGDKSDCSLQDGGRILGFLRDVRNLILSVCEFKIINKIPLIDPDGPSYFPLQFVLVTLNAFYFLFFSLFYFFQAPPEYNSILKKIAIILWGLEICSKLNTSHYKSRKEIFVKYIQSSALWDILPFVVSCISYIPSEIEPFLNLIVYLKLKNVFKDVDDVQRYLCMTFKDYYLIQLANLIVKMFLIGHIIACVWYLVGVVELDYLGEETTWFENGVGQDGTWWKLYIDAIFWSLTLMTTGSNVATTVLQLSFTVFIMLFTTIIFGYMLNVVGFILSELDKKNESKRRDLNLINEYMRNKKVSKYLQKKVNEDIEYFYQKNLKKIEEDNNEILGRVSEELQEDLKHEYNSLIVANIPVLENNFSKDAIAELANVIQEVTFFPNQLVFQEEDSKDHAIFFIVQGSMKICCSAENQRKQMKLFEANRGSIVGEVGFFVGGTRKNSCYSNEFTKAVKISREKFIESISKFEKDIQRFYEIRDKVGNYQSYSEILYSCKFCSFRNHLESECPFVHTSKSPLALKSIFVKNEDAKRNIAQREKRHRNCLSSLKIVKTSIETFRKDNQEEFELENSTMNENSHFSLASSIHTEEDEINKKKESMLTSITKKQTKTEIVKMPTFKERDGKVKRSYKSDHGDFQEESSQKVKINKNISKNNEKHDYGVDELESMCENEMTGKQGYSIQVQEALRQCSPQISNINKRIPYFSEFNQSLIFNREGSMGRDDQMKNICQTKYSNKITSSQMLYEDLMADDDDYEKNHQKIHDKNGNENGKNGQQYQKHVHEKEKNVFLNCKTKVDDAKNKKIPKEKSSNEPFKSNQQVNQIINEINGELLEENEGDDNDDEIELEKNMWDFDKVFDYRFYFPQGNSRTVILRHHKYWKKKVKLVLRKPKKRL